MDNLTLIEQALVHNIPVKALDRDRHAVEFVTKFTRSTNHLPHHAVYIDKDGGNTIIDLAVPGEQIGRWIVEQGELDRIARRLHEIRSTDTVGTLAPWVGLIDQRVEDLPYGVGCYITIRAKELLQPGQEQDDLTYRVSRLYQTETDPCVMVTGHTLYEGRIVAFVGEAWRFKIASFEPFLSETPHV